MMVVNTAVAEANAAFAKALVGAWYETMALMAGGEAAAIAARSAMAEASGTDLAGYDLQLASTKMFYEPAAAVAFARSLDLISTMDHVRRFSDSHGLLEGGLDFVGIAFPGGEVLGDPSNIKLRFTDAYMQMAVDGAL